MPRLVLVPRLVQPPLLALVLLLAQPPLRVQAPLVLLRPGPVWLLQGLAPEPAWLRAQALGQVQVPQPAERKSGTSRGHACHRHTADRS